MVRVQPHSFACDYPVFPFAEKTVPLLFISLGTFVKNKLIIYVRIYFQTLFYSIDVHICLYATVWIAVCSFVMFLKSGSVSSPILFFFKTSCLLRDP